MEKQDSDSGSLRHFKAWSTAAAGIGGIAALVFALRWFGEVSGHCGVVRFYEYILGAAIIVGWLISTAAGWKLGTSRRRGPALLGLVMVLLAASGMAVAAARTFSDPAPPSAAIGGAKCPDG